MPTICCQACTEGDQVHNIADAHGQTWRFEMHRFCGPIVLRKTDGLPKERQPGSRSPFWPAFDAWNSARKTR